MNMHIKLVCVHPSTNSIKNVQGDFCDRSVTSVFAIKHNRFSKSPSVGSTGLVCSTFPYLF